MGNLINDKKEKDITKNESKESKHKEKKENKNITNKCKIIFLGDSGIGSKTSLIKRMNHNVFTPNITNKNSCSFISKSIKIKNGKKIIMNFWDINGHEIFRNLTKKFLENSDCVVLGYDVTNINSFKNIQDFWYKFSKDNSSTNLIYLIGNKIDLLNERKVEKDIARSFAEKNNIKYFEISCATSEGVQEFFDDLKNELFQK